MECSYFWIYFFKRHFPLIRCPPPPSPPPFEPLTTFFSKGKMLLREGVHVHSPTALPLSQQVPALGLHNAHSQQGKRWNNQIRTFDKGIMISFQYSPFYRDTVFSSSNYNIYLIRLSDAFHGMRWTAFFPAPGLHSKLLNCNQLQKLPVRYPCSETLQAWCKIYYL